MPKKSHGMSKTTFYRKYFNINARCNKSSHNSFKNYGGRGIRVEWQSFEEFRDDMYESYLEHVNKVGKYNTNIDRINNDGNYCKENCRWVTMKENLKNRRNTINLTYEGVTAPLSDWADAFGIPVKQLDGMIRRGWAVEKALYFKK